MLRKHLVALTLNPIVVEQSTIAVFRIVRGTTYPNSDLAPNLIQSKV